LIAVEQIMMSIAEGREDRAFVVKENKDVPDSEV
jgi:hypothetical protein